MCCHGGLVGYDGRFTRGRSRVRFAAVIFLLLFYLQYMPSWMLSLYFNHIHLVYIRFTVGFWFMRGKYRIGLRGGRTDANLDSSPGSEPVVPSCRAHLLCS